MKKPDDNSQKTKHICNSEKNKELSTHKKAQSKYGIKKPVYQILLPPRIDRKIPKMKF